MPLADTLHTHAPRSLGTTVATVAKDDHDDSRTDACYLLCLPTELLSKILSYVLPIGCLATRNETDFPTSFKALCAFRSVCRTIRSVADNLPFWCDESFLLEQLCPWSIREYPYDAARYIEGFLEDNHLRESLSRKKEWNINDYDSFRFKARLSKMLVRMVPEFKENAESLTGFAFPVLRKRRREIDLDKLLQECPRLREFDFTSKRVHVHAENLPATLRRLSFTHYNSPAFGHCTCNFNGVRNLEYF
jgi:hypothetical protein